jgi:uncharacterized membrane protein YgdD (TMEM256/DUF423 family)
VGRALGLSVERRLYLLGAIAGFLAVAFGAFAGHALKSRLTPDMLAVFETGVRYQMVHALALLAAACGYGRWQHRAFALGGILFAAGIVVFCGSLYALALSGERWLGAVTPLGGLAFLAGWLCLVRGALTKLRA